MYKETNKQLLNNKLEDTRLREIQLSGFYLNYDLSRYLLLIPAVLFCRSFLTTFNTFNPTI